MQWAGAPEKGAELHEPRWEGIGYEFPTGKKRDSLRRYEPDNYGAIPGHGNIVMRRVK